MALLSEVIEYYKTGSKLNVYCICIIYLEFNIKKVNLKIHKILDFTIHLSNKKYLFLTNI